jgi:hypothetical protein
MDKFQEHSRLPSTAFKDQTISLIEHLQRHRFRDVPLLCSSLDNPGIDEIAEWQVWIDKNTTPDQIRIEDYLLRIIKSEDAILHVGVGNSSLAKKVCPHGTFVLGTTIHEEEKFYADSSRIQNYVVLLANKYSNDMNLIDHRFDFIVDNNPSSFACCLYHFCSMLVAYRRLLRRGGSILTADPGMGWVINDGNPNWALKWDDWVLIASALGLSANRVDKFVYAMR